jgi:hypothetical protein
MLSGLEKASGGIVRANDALLDRFANTVSDQTGVELSTWQKGIEATKDVAKKSVLPALGGAGNTMAGGDPFVSAAIAGSYGLYKGGLLVLRRIETGSRAGKTILRESADATNGLDQVARLAVAANPAVPTAVREVLERPSNFIPLESTPARIASNPAFGPTTRAVADRLSNPLVVQAVRNTAALAKGSAKGAIANAPFAYMSANAGDEEGAAAAIGSGLAFGAGLPGDQEFQGRQRGPLFAGRHLPVGLPEHGLHHRAAAWVRLVAGGGAMRVILRGAGDQQTGEQEEFRAKVHASEGGLRPR